MFRHRPAMKFCIPFILGIALGWQLNIPLWISSGVLVVLFSLLVLTPNLKSGDVSFRRDIVFFLLLIASGILNITIDGKELSTDNISRFIIADREVHVSGRVTDAPRYTARSLRFIVEAESITVDNKQVPVSGGILVSVLREQVGTDFQEKLSYGNNIHMRGKLTLPSRARNPGEFDYRQYLLLNGVYAQVFLDKNEMPLITSPDQTPLLQALVYSARSSIALQLDSYFDERESNFLKGLIIGERSELPQDIKADFIAAGVMHILAVSGLHIVIVTMMLMVVFQILRFPELPRIMVVICLLVYYGFLTGGSASVVRSVIMAIVFLLSKTMERKADMYNVLAVSAVIILAYDARQLFQPGFQLSYMAVFSLVYFYPKITSVQTYLPDFFQRKSITLVLQAVAVTLAATIGTIPFSVYYFGQVSVIGIAANIIAVPLSNGILCLGMLTTAVSYMSPWIADIYAAATSFLTFCLLKSVDMFADAPFAVYTMRFDTVVFLALYGAIAVILNARQRESWRILIIGILFSVNAWVYYSAIFHPEKERVRVTFIDVGQGDAALVQLPGGENILIDAGPVSMSYDAGSRFLLPFFRYSGVHRIDAVVISHPHSDHLGGLLSVLRHVEVGSVIDAGSATTSTLFYEYVRLLDSLGINRKVVLAGRVIPISSSVRFYVLHPGRIDMEEHPNLNNQSVVIKMQYGETSLLFSGDAEHEAEETMVQSYGAFLRSNIVKIGHHGSKTSSTEEFIRSVNPDIGVISVGLNNKFRHPSPEVLHRLSGADCQILRTDREGAIIFESDGKQWKQVGWR